MRRLLPLLLFFAAACAHTPPRSATGDRPRLVVLLVIDQVPSWAFEPRLKLLDGGLGRLIREGVYYPQAVYPYAATFTACGHAALVTGAPPAVTGMLANKWWDRREARVMEATEDAGHPLLEVAGAPGVLGGSPVRLRVASVGDALLQSTPNAKVVTVSYKDRSAILLGGRHPTLSVWYDPAQAAFTTSTWYAQSPPAWLATLAKEHPIGPRLAGYVWTPLDADGLARETGLPDDAPGEADSYGFGISFPHALAKAELPREDVEGTPLADEITLEAVFAALDGEALGQDETPDLLAISLSVHDYIGHVYGQESWETLDVLLREDRLVGQLLDRLDEKVGKGKYAVVFTSDHGAEPTIEQAKSAVVRIDPFEVEKAAEKAAATVAGEGDWIAPGRDPSFYLTVAAQALPKEKQSALIDAVVDEVRRFPGVGYAERTDRLAGHCDDRAERDALICRSIDPERSGEVFFGAADGSVIMAPPMEATGHGSAALADRTVPLVLVFPGQAPRRVDEPVSPLRVAPTLASWLGIAPPSTATEKALP